MLHSINMSLNMYIYILYIIYVYIYVIHIHDIHIHYTSINIHILYFASFNYYTIHTSLYIVDPGLYMAYCADHMHMCMLCMFPGGGGVPPEGPGRGGVLTQKKGQYVVY